MPIAGQIAQFDDTQYMRANVLVPRAHAIMRVVVRTYAEMIQLHMMDNMRGSKSGRKYWRPGGRIHIASAPGEAPAVDTGRLISDLHIRHEESTGAVFAVVGTEHTKYAGFLEHGTRRMKPRPFLKPAVTAYTRRFRDALEIAVSRIG